MKEISRRSAWALWLGSSLVTTLLFFLLHPLCQREGEAPAEAEGGELVYLAEAPLGKERLPPGYLQELLQLSSSTISLKKMEELLLTCPLIRSGQIRLPSPSVIHVSYTMRTPIARIADIDNGAIDSEGVCFPLRPFFTPKNLPSLYLGLTPREIDNWGQRIQGERIELSFFSLISFLNSTIEKAFPFGTSMYPMPLRQASVDEKSLSRLAKSSCSARSTIEEKKAPPTTCACALPTTQNNSSTISNSATTSSREKKQCKES